MINIIEGNILNADCDIIAHQVNCRGVMGGGLAKQIAQKHPNVYKEYYNEYLSCPEKHLMLGCCKVVDVTYDYVGNYRYVANLYGQNYYGHDKRYTNYEALYNALEELSIFANNKYHDLDRNIIIAIPYKLGCGLAGGNWNIVRTMIEEIFLPFENKITITLYKYE